MTLPMDDAATPELGTPEPGGSAPIPLPMEGANSIEAWTARIKASQDAIQPITLLGQKNIQAYRGKSITRGTVIPTDTVVVNKDFANVEQKKPQLFGQVPVVQLTAELPGLDGAIDVFEAVLNKYLSPKGVNAGAMMDEVLFDVLCPAGYGACKIGYEAFQDGVKSIPTGKMIPDQNAPPPPPTMPGMPPMPPMPPPMIPEMVDVPNIVFEKYGMDRFSPAKAIVPKEFGGSDFDKAAFLGQEFVLDTAVAVRKYQLPETFAKGSAQDDHRLVDLPDGSRSGRALVRGFEIWYQAHLFDPTVKHPLLIRQLVIIDGYDQPVVHRDSPYQQQTPAGDILGMTGFPIEILTLRYVSDTWAPPSDCSISRAAVDELGMGRTQMIQQRKRSLPMRWANLEAIGGQETLDKIENGTIQSIIPVQGDGNQMMGQVATAQFPRENFEFNRVTNDDIGEIWAMGANQRGMETSESKTATELAIVDKNKNIRMDAERAKVLLFFVRCAEKLGALIQQFATETDYVTLEGLPKAQALRAWDKTTIAGKFAYSARPDATVRVDASQSKAEALQQYQLLANDPFINRAELVTELIRKMDLDPSKIVVQPPPKPPETPKIAYSFQGTDIDPSLPQFPIVMEILRAGGVQISQQAIQQAQQHAIMLASVGMGPGAAQQTGQAAASHQRPTEHPGMTNDVSPLSKHAADRTGERAGPPTMDVSGVN